eukprot:TRINITY_DN36916_c0_g1_i1.p1 TRINITY_DN36916_c0_g1~~TRINITY_DN36916_c0_g1_i1.p1  ORF type:complete len:295 (+),score=72.41 TRINITY_DN36916_c0_g1_i1:41-925(+)
MGMMKKGISKGRSKRAPLAKGSQRKGRRVKKEKVPTKFIVNPDKGGGDGEIWRGAVALSDSDDTEPEVEKVQQQQHAGGNRATRRANLRYELEKKKYEEEYGGIILKRRRLQKGQELENRMTSEERENLTEQRAHKQGGYMKYNYLQCHPSWLASKQIRRRQQTALEDHEIQVFDDCYPPQEDPISQTQGETEEIEEEEEYEEYEEEDEELDPLFPSLEPIRRRTVWAEDCVIRNYNKNNNNNTDNTNITNNKNENDNNLCEGSESDEESESDQSNLSAEPAKPIRRHTVLISE